MTGLHGVDSKRTMSKIYIVVINKEVILSCSLTCGPSRRPEEFQGSDVVLRFVEMLVQGPYSAARVTVFAS